MKSSVSRFLLVQCASDSPSNNYFDFGQRSNGRIGLPDSPVSQKKEGMLMSGFPNCYCVCPMTDQTV